jgi:hypothetical protein
VEIKVSDDQFIDQGKRGVVVSVQSRATQAILSHLNRTGDVPLICMITSYHNTNVVDPFYVAAEKWAGSGNTIIVTILNAKEKVLCVLEGTKVERFSWSATLEAMM